MNVEKSRQVFRAGYHMLSHGDQQTPWLEYAQKLATCRGQITRVVQHGARKYNIELSVIKGQSLRKLLCYLDWQSSRLGEPTDGLRPNERAAVGLQGRNFEAVFGECKAGDTPTRAHIKRMSALGR